MSENLQSFPRMLHCGDERLIVHSTEELDAAQKLGFGLHHVVDVAEVEPVSDRDHAAEAAPERKGKTAPDRKGKTDKHGPE